MQLHQVGLVCSELTIPECGRCYCCCRHRVLCMLQCSSSESGLNTQSISISSPISSPSSSSSSFPTVQSVHPNAPAISLFTSSSSSYALIIRPIDNPTSLRRRWSSARAAQRRMASNVPLPPVPARCELHLHNAETRDVALFALRRRYALRSFRRAEPSERRTSSPPVGPSARRVEPAM